MDKNKFTKAEIVENIYLKLNTNKSTIKSILDMFFMEIREGLKEDKVVELRGFGTFELKTRKGRIRARNPRTGEMVQGKKHSIAIFRAGKEMKEEVWDVRNRKEDPEKQHSEST